MGGTSHCVGTVESNEGEWKPVDMNWRKWNWLNWWSIAAVVCRELDCGSTVSIRKVSGSSQDAWMMDGLCLGSEPSLRDCGTKSPWSSSDRLEVTCSGEQQ